MGLRDDGWVGHLRRRMAGANRLTRPGEAGVSGEGPLSETVLLRRWREGDDAALEELTPLIYGELRRLARLRMRDERRGHTLQPTDLVHEAYARMVDLELSWQDRAHFLSMSARVMRRVLVDHARRRSAQKRGGDPLRISLAGDQLAAEPELDLMALDQAMGRLREQEERPARVIELRYFGGLSYGEIAAALGISKATVERDLRFARAWLLTELG